MIYRTYTISIEDEDDTTFLQYFEAFVEHNSTVVGVRDHYARTTAPEHEVELDGKDALVLGDYAYEADREDA